MAESLYANSQRPVAKGKLNIDSDEETFFIL